jgi:BirA family transcriptional regulator, biotin operon repressor / biotin---[acetyl-CoA-carboxylase] ligase
MASMYDDLDRPPLDAAAVRRALVGPGQLWREIDVVATAPSTNDLVAGLARAGAPEGTVVVTEHQTAGRGRLDRTWTTPARAALTLSALLRPRNVPASHWPWLPLLTGVALADSLRRTAEVDAQLKWPNDVLIGQRKVAGILLERVETSQGPAAVVGMGVNVSSRPDELPVSSATSLALEHAATTDRSVLLRSLLRTLAALYADWAGVGGDPARGLADSYARRCSTLGRVVHVELPTGQPVVGLAREVDVAGRLVVAAADGTLTALSAGDVTHLRVS